MTWRTIDNVPENDSVLVWTEHGPAIAELSDGEWHLVACNDAIFKGDDFHPLPCWPVTHWMPLPDPPEESGQW